MTFIPMTTAPESDGWPRGLECPRGDSADIRCVTYVLIRPLRGHGTQALGDVTPPDIRNLAEYLISSDDLNIRHNAVPEKDGWSRGLQSPRSGGTDICCIGEFQAQPLRGHGTQALGDVTRPEYPKI
jgi:hypothetical protein